MELLIPARLAICPNSISRDQRSELVDSTHFFLWHTSLTWTETEHTHYPTNCSRYLQANTERFQNNHNLAERAFKANTGHSISQLGIGAIRGLALLDYFLAFLAALCWMKSCYNSQKCLCTSLCSPFILPTWIQTWFSACLRNTEAFGELATKYTV